MKAQDLHRLGSLIRPRLETDFLFALPLDNGGLEGLCAISSYATMLTLRQLGERATFVYGKFSLHDDRRPEPRRFLHCWTECGGHSLDLTATQFGPRFGKVIVKSRRSEDFVSQYECSHRGEDGLAIVSLWKHQSPFHPHNNRLILDLVRDTIRALKKEPATA